MKTKKHYIVSGLMFIAFVILGASEAFAQGPPPPPTGVPLDGGMTILGGIAAGYGIKKIREAKNKKNQEL